MKKLLFAMLAAFLAMPAGYCQTKDTTGLAQMVSEIINNVEKNRQNRNIRIDNYEGKGTMVFFARKNAVGASHGRAATEGFEPSEAFFMHSLA